MATKTRGPKATIKEAAAQKLLADARRSAAKAATWMELHNAIFGIGGKFMEHFPSQADRSRFVKTEEYRMITALIDAKMGGQDDSPIAELLGGANGKILVRVPKSVHAALLAEADAEGVSLNQLCVAKLAVQLRAAG